MSGRLLLALSLLACCCLPGSGALPNVRQCLGNAGRFVLRRGPVKKVEIVQNEAPLPPLRRTIKQNVVELVKNGVASGMASASVKSVLHPFDVVKTMQQHSSEDLDIIQAARKIIARDGGWVSSIAVSFAGSVPSIAVYFAVYQYMKRMLTALFGPGYLQATLVRVPTEMVKQRVQAGIYPSATAAFKDMWAKGGAQQFLCSRTL
ncbi:mitochondrial carrier domain-containing protein [Baffinella frigidus]|nr:mitochondrial carrier domain-containing protein [Cryptophyta sp. CCMP2293]